MNHFGPRLLTVMVMALVLVACGGNSSTSNPIPTPSVPAGDKEVDLIADATNVGIYKPDNVTVKVGDTVAWVFKDPDNPHTVTADDNSFDSDPDGTGHNGGYVYTQTFTKAGTVKYHCTLHTGMTGQVIVTAT
jgi:plastocyanin